MIKYIFNYFKSIIWVLLIKYDNQNEIKYKCLLRSLQRSGCIPIKFVQWLIPILYILVDDHYYQYINIFKNTYEECEYHSIEYTKKKYKQIFNKNLNDDFNLFTIKKIASGSIGQVYQVKDRNDNVYALKIIHPYIGTEIYIIEKLFKFLFKILNFKFIDIQNLFNIFKKQTDLVHESNNLLYFYHKLDNNDKIIIPKLYKISSDIMIMEYIEGYNIINSNSNIRLLINIFVMDCLYNYNIIHGDLHIGNLKMNKNNDKLIIYDFGYCWDNISNDISDKILYNLNEAIILYNYQSTINNEVLRKKQNYTDFLEINNIFNDKLINKFYEMNNVIEYFKYLIQIFYEENIQIDIYIINLILIMIHIYKYTDGNVLILDQYNYCNTYNLFNNYKKILYNDIKKYDILNLKIKSNYNINDFDLKKFL